jgi:hypothetical protein
MSIKVVIAAHKKNEMPTDTMYLPLYVGAQGEETIPYLGDNTGDHISEKNSTFCELTGLYWAWKNLSDEYIGLVHYRRYFATRHFRSKQSLKKILTGEQAEALLKGRDGILPAPRQYVIETLYSHYMHTNYIEPLDMAGKIIAEKYPTYVAAFERLKMRTSGHMFNMFILRRDHFDAYCTWLFDILFELEKRVDASQYTPYHARFFGRVSELMFNVWLENNPLDCAILPVMHTTTINWFAKGAAFLKAKFMGKKYTKSF